MSMINYKLSRVENELFYNLAIGARARTNFEKMTYTVVAIVKTRSSVTETDKIRFYMNRCGPDMKYGHRETQ